MTIIASKSFCSMYLSDMKLSFYKMLILKLLMEMSMYNSIYLFFYTILKSFIEK